MCKGIAERLKRMEQTVSRMQLTVARLELAFSLIRNKLKTTLNNHSYTTASIETIKNSMEKFFALYIAHTQIKEVSSIEDNIYIIKD